MDTIKEEVEYLNKLSTQGNWTHGWAGCHNVRAGENRFRSELQDHDHVSQ